MNSIRSDIAIGILFIIGIWSFISGEFIVSTVLFGLAAMLSNIFPRKKLD